jgi:hypothetical protein
MSLLSVKSPDPEPQSGLAGRMFFGIIPQYDRIAFCKSGGYALFSAHNLNWQAI